MRVLLANSNITSCQIDVDLKRAWRESATNLGHMFIGESLRKMLARYQVDEVSNIWSPWLGAARRGGLEDYEVIVLSLQDIIRGGLPQPIFDYTALSDFLETITGRLIVIGLGANTLHENPRDLVRNMSPTVRGALDVLCDRADHIGVRGEYTAATLELLGVQTATVVGCPSFFGQDLSQHSFDFKIDAFAFSGDFIPDQFDERLDYFVAQDEVPALRAINDLEFTERDEQEWLHTDPSWRGPLGERLRQITNAGRAVAFSSPDMWRGFLKDKVGACVGGRFHNGVAGLGAGVPILLVNPDMRTREFAEYMRFPYKPFLQRNVRRDQLADLIDMQPFRENYVGAANRMHSFFSGAGLDVIVSGAR